MTSCSRRTVAILFLAMASARPTAAQQPAAEAFLTSIYTRYVGRNSSGLDFNDQEDRFFTPDLADAMKRDREENRGMVGALDWDPFIDGQAWEITNLAIAVTTDGAKATGHVTFNNFSKPIRVVIDLVQTHAGWRIADIAWPGKPAGYPGSLRAVFKLR